MTDEQKLVCEMLETLVVVWGTIRTAKQSPANCGKHIPGETMLDEIEDLIERARKVFLAEPKERSQAV